MALSHAILNEGRITIDTYHWNTIDKAYYKGHYYTDAAPGLSVLAVPVLALFQLAYSLVPDTLVQRLNKALIPRLESSVLDWERPYLSFAPEANKIDLVEFHASILILELLIAAVTTFCAVLFSRLLRLAGVSQMSSWIYALLLGTGTMLFYYATTPYTAAPVAFFQFCAFYRIFRAKLTTTRARMVDPGLVMAGTCLGAAVSIAYQEIFGAVVLTSYAILVLGWRRSLSVVVGGALVGTLFLLYHYEAFDHPLSLANAHDIGLFRAHQSELLGIAYPQGEAVYQLLLGTSYGMFVYNPVLLLTMSLLVARLARGGAFRAEAAVAAAMLVSYIAFLASYAFPSGGVYGPRYAAACVPFMMLGVILIRTRLQKALFSGFATVSVLLNWLSVQHLRRLDLDDPWATWMVSEFRHTGPCSTALELLYQSAGIGSRFAMWSIGIVAHAVLLGGLYVVLARLGPRIWRQATFGVHDIQMQ
jgi:hypothetical protein